LGFSVPPSIHPNLLARDHYLEILADTGNDRIQKFDPPGIGAKNLQECLLLQLKNKIEVEGDKLDDEEILIIQLCVRIIDEYFRPYINAHRSTFSTTLIKLAMRPVLGSYLEAEA